MQREQRVAFNARLPVGLDDWIARKAAENRRTKTAELIVRLEAAMAADTTPPASAGSEPAAGRAS